METMAEAEKRIREEEKKEGIIRAIIAKLGHIKLLANKKNSPERLEEINSDLSEICGFNSKVPAPTD